MRFVLAALPFIAALASGCPSDGGSLPDGTTDAVADGDGGLSPAAAAIVVQALPGLGAAAALGAPLAEDGDALRRDAAPTDAVGRDLAEHGFSGGSVVTPPTCATYAWSGTSATVTLSGCTLETTGEPVSGTVTLAVVLRPAAFDLSFGSLTIGTTTLDGSVTLHAGGSDLGGAEPTLDADLTYSDGTTTTHLVASGLGVTATTTAVAVSGTFTVESGGTTTTLEATAVSWAAGECLPSSGTLQATGSAFPLPVTVTFLTTTPADGIVQVQVGSFPSANVPLLPPCA
ncbi:MAG: hypothetical protein HY907_16765 [Deltaproteobacteria bacterium]|nr:hypothetical protein [Deltaproteobacteria bacterium]